MKVAYIYPHFARLAGTERVLIEKMNYLANYTGVEVFMVTYEQASHPIAFPLSQKVMHIDLDVRFFRLYKYNRFLRLFKWYEYNKILRNRFNQFMMDVRPDIVVATTFHGNIMSMISECPIPSLKVLESHIDKRFIHKNDPVNSKNRVTWLRSIYDMNVLNRKSKDFDVVIVLNEQDAEDWSKMMRVRIIPNVVHLNETGRYSSQESKHVIFVGRFELQKGIPDLFEIWKQVYNHHPDWYLDIYGDGDVNMIPGSKKERLSMNIHIHNSDPNIFERYIDSSILVLTSLYEPFGLVMPEAMSCGLPVVAFDCPSGPANIITDGVDGFVIKGRNIKMFAEKLCQLIESNDLRLAMSGAAILSSKKYSAELVMPQWMQLFNDLLTVA